MNLNDIMPLLPLSIRGRFSSQDNAWWIKQAGSCIKRMEKLPVGPGRVRKVMAYQMTSGFIPKPPCLSTINYAWLDGVPVVSVKDKDDRGFPMDKGTVDFTKFDVTVQACSDERVTTTINSVPVPGDAMGFNTATVASFDAAAKEAYISDWTGAYGTEDNSLADLQIWIRGEYFVITSSIYGSTGQDKYYHIFLNNTSTLPNPTEHLTLQPMGPAKTDSLAGFELFSGIDHIEAAASHTLRLGYAEFPSFTLERGAPGRLISGRPEGYLLKSNLLVEGYRKLALPTSMTDELDVPDGAEDLIASFLRARAESDMDPDSSVAIKCNQDFETNLRRYAVEQSETQGDSMPQDFNMTPTFFRGSF